MIKIDERAAMQTQSRIDWVDFAKGICIVAVVAMYATGYVEEALRARGWMHYFVAFAQPFRMPDFFLISGLFVARVAGRRWRDYIDTKVVHFLYFYALWVTIKFIIIKGPGIVGPARHHMLADYLSVYLQPHGPLWFIYMLPLFFIAVRLLHPLPAWLVLALAISLKLADIGTGWKMIDRFGIYFVFFYSGHLFASQVFRMAAWGDAHPRATLLVLTAWFAANTILVQLGLTFLPAVHLLTGLAGAAAIILLSVLLARVHWMQWLRYLGEHSIVVYLAFVVPLALLRKLFFAIPPATNTGTVAIGTIAASIAGALVLYWTVRNTPMRFLFERPSWASLRPLRQLKEKQGAL